MEFNPNDIGNTNLNIFGLPFTEKDAQLILLPVPWDTTVSYNRGTAASPDAIFEASFQVDLFDPFLKDAWKKGIAMADPDKDLIAQNKALTVLSSKIIDHLSKGGDILKSPTMKKTLNKVNSGCKLMVDRVKQLSETFIDDNKFVAVIGGDHSVPLGLMQALAGKHSTFGILHIDAHADLRNAYEGFEYSHASIMHHAIKIKNVKKLVQVGIRDFCEEEVETINASNGRIKTFFDRDMQYLQFNGVKWDTICNDIINELPEKVYISFDIDGLTPDLCPNTGTPVPGGLQYYQTIYLLEKLVLAKKKIIGFDLCEVSPGTTEWDTNVGARILFKLANCLARSNNFRNIYK
jgi:agmatinase